MGEINIEAGPTASLPRSHRRELLGAPKPCGPSNSILDVDLSFNNLHGCENPVLNFQGIPVVVCVVFWCGLWGFVWALVVAPFHLLHEIFVSALPAIGHSIAALRKPVYDSSPQALPYPQASSALVPGIV